MNPLSNLGSSTQIVKTFVVPTDSHTSPALVTPAASVAHAVSPPPITIGVPCGIPILIKSSFISPPTTSVDE